ncbi:MAG: formylglycine-generating enzyme family protein [Pseudomonadota bacterium]
MRQAYKVMAVLLFMTPLWCGAEPKGIFVAGGQFVMGTASEDIPELVTRYQVTWRGAFVNEAEAHKVTLSDFHFDPHEVTYEKFAEFLVANPQWQKQNIDESSHNGDYLKDWTKASYPEDKTKHPVVFITWASAQSYCRWRGGQLPTEAQWEYVARSGDDREFPWGEKLPFPEIANYHASGHRGSLPVGSYLANQFGIYDLAGNVWEFLLDEWVESYPAEEQTDPIVGGPISDENISSITGRRAVRGASYGGSVVNLRTRWRDSHRVDNPTMFVGFRCAYDLETG